MPPRAKSGIKDSVSGEELDGSERPVSGSKSGLAASVAGLRTRPMQVTWEMTSACHWRASSPRTSARAAREREREQLSTAEAFHLIEEVAAMRVPLLALTGGDPLLRPDLLPVIEFASKRAVRTSLTLLPTPMLETETIDELKASGLMRVAFWLHGSTPGLHDGYWSVPDPSGGRLRSSGTVMRSNCRFRSTRSLRDGTFTTLKP